MTTNQSAIQRLLNRIQEERLRQGVSQNALAKTSGIKQAQISRLESGRSKDPSLATVLSLMGALGLSWSIFDETLAATTLQDNRMRFHPAEQQGPAILDYEITSITNEDGVGVTHSTDGVAISIMQFEADNVFAPLQKARMAYCFEQLLADFVGPVHITQSMNNDDKLITYVSLVKPASMSLRSLVLHVQDWQRHVQAFENTEKLGFQVLDKDVLSELLNAYSSNAQATACYQIKGLWATMNPGELTKLLTVDGVTTDVSVQLADQESAKRIFQTRQLKLESHIDKQHSKGILPQASKIKEYRDILQLLSAMEEHITYVFDVSITVYLQANTLGELQRKEEQLLCLAKDIYLERLERSNPHFKLTKHRLHSQWLGQIAPWEFSPSAGTDPDTAVRVPHIKRKHKGR
jgi:transcriptional regulator with XRE-family HTH domain